MKLGKRVYFVTNNSTKSRAQYVDKITKYGIPIKDSSQVLSSAFAAASYLKSIKFNKKALIVGHEGIERELKLHDIKYVNSTEVLGGKQWAVKDLLKLKIDKEIGAVVVGMDLEFTYSKSALAALTIQANEGCFLLSTNQDHTFPAEGGKFLPGSGAGVAHIEAASNMKAINVGKPERFLFEHLRKSCNDIKLQRTIMVGDRLNTDMQFGNNGGAHSLLVLSGVTLKEDLEKPIVQQQRPRYVVESISKLFG
ncbi:hypothetical protein AAMO2058_001045100 [Amorphochlora amoebiformis]